MKYNFLKNFILECTLLQGNNYNTVNVDIIMKLQIKILEHCKKITINNID